MQALHQVGLSIESYSALFVAGNVVQVLIGCGIGSVIFWRRSDDWMALLVMLLLITFSIGNPGNPPDLLPLVNPAWELPIRLLHALSSMATVLVLFLFPTGRFVPRWTRWVATVYLLQQFSELELPPEWPVNSQNWPVWFNIAFFAPTFLTVVFAQVYRYWRDSTPAQQRQTKWVILGIVAALGGTLVLVVPLVLVPELQQSAIYDLFFYLGIGIVYTFFLVCIGVAVLRSRLFDIDVILNRALVYGTLTTLLAGVYFSVVLGAQVVVRAVTGKPGQQPVFIITSTLLVATLFNPLRRYLQAFIDHRFYRRKYDAARSLAAFGVTLRGEVDLEQLGEQLLRVVRETMQPSQASLWLRPSPNRRARQ
jgi:hypothetical protein